jgi:hypothetical protein
VILSYTSIQTHNTKTLFVENNHQNNTEGEIFSYDKEKYGEVILDAAETVLGYFGFDRMLYGDKKNTATRKMVVVGRTNTRRRKRYQGRDNRTIGNKKYETVINKGILLSSSF